MPHNRIMKHNDAQWNMSVACLGAALVLFACCSGAMSVVLGCCFACCAGATSELLGNCLDA
eukprot:877610-Lingulodinium_polyedra.AAC.1